MSIGISNPAPDNSPDTIVNLLSRAGEAFRNAMWGAARDLFEEAIRLDPRHEEAAMQSAACSLNLADPAWADETLSRLLTAFPSSYRAWMELAEVRRLAGHTHLAIEAYERASRLAPYRFEPLMALGILMEEARIGDHASILDRALTLARAVSLDAAEKLLVRLTQQRLLRRNGQGALDAADAGLKSAAGRKAPFDVLAEWMVRRGEALLLLGRQTEAWQVLSAASGATDEVVLARLGEMSFNHGLMEEAEQVFRRNLDLHPNSGYAWFNLGKILATRWKVPEALERLDGAERRLSPTRDASTLKQIQVTRAETHWRSGNSEAAFEAFSALNERLSGMTEIPASIALTSLYNDNLDGAKVRDIHRALFAALGEGARPARSFSRAPLAGRRPRVGMVGGDMRRHHPVNIFLQPILRELDRSRIELFFYNTGAGFDDQTKLARDRVEHWTECAGWSDERLATAMDCDKLDLLVDLSGHTGQSRAALLARRAAPVQALYLGYPGTTGVPNVDWLIGDPIVTPPELDHLYTERMYRLPGVVFCYAPEDAFPLGRDRGSDTRPVVFGSIHNAPKLNTRTLRLFTEVLARVETSRLMLRAPGFIDEPAIGYFRDKLKDLGADLGRIDFLPPVALDEMMEALSDVDIMLDAVPYGGGTTTHEALWMGVPTVTLAGEGFASRMGASIMESAGLPEWIASSDRTYVDIAVAMAADRVRLADLKRNLRDRLMRNPGWDPVRHTRAFEDALCAMAASRA